MFELEITFSSLDNSRRLRRAAWRKAPCRSGWSDGSRTALSLRERRRPTSPGPGPLDRLLAERVAGVHPDHCSVNHDRW